MKKRINIEDVWVPKFKMTVGEAQRKINDRRQSLSRSHAKALANGDTVRQGNVEWQLEGLAEKQELIDELRATL